MVETPVETLSAGRLELRGSPPYVMGVLNLTPDSFSDGGRFVSRAAAVDHAASMVAEGAAILDIGGESTRPGAKPVSEQVEIDRVMPVVEALYARFAVPLSVDTSNPRLMRLVVDAGASMLNDVRSFERPGAFEVAADTDVAICLMHRQGEPQDMQLAPSYTDPLGEISAYLKQRLAAAIAAGIDRSRVLLDPGFGFGKTLEHNVEVLSRLDDLHEHGCPLLVGLSRKRMIGELTGRDIDQRDTASAVAAAIAGIKGAAILRAHNVAATLDAARIAAAIRLAEERGR